MKDKVTMNQRGDCCLKRTRRVRKEIGKGAVETGFKWNQRKDRKPMKIITLLIYDEIFPSPFGGGIGQPPPEPTSSG
jgi:hypothetical protein